MGLLNLLGLQDNWVHVTLYYNDDSGFLITPHGKHKKFGSMAINPVIKLNCGVSEEDLGKGLLSSVIVTERYIFAPLRILQSIKNPPDLIAKASGIKNFSKFSKMFRCLDISRSPHGYKVQEWHREPKYGSYQGPSDDKSAVHLPLSATALELGQAVMACLAVKYEEPADGSIMNFQLLDGRTMLFKRPPDEYVNVGDAHTDAHQVFEHAEMSGVFFGFSYGTSYDQLDSTTVKKIWERYYGSLGAFEFSRTTEPPFSHVAKAEGKDRIIRAFFFTDDGIWNEFLLHVNTSSLSKKQVKCIMADYEATARSCVLSDSP